MKYYKKDILEIYSILNSQKKGLNNFEAKKRLEKFGKNKIEVKNEISKIKIFINQFKSFIIYVLLFAVIISLLISEFVDAFIIMIILFLNAIIGYYQELNAQKSLDALKKLTKINAKVYRDNNLEEIDSKLLVPGDIIFLEAGDKVPADIRIIEEKRLVVNESNLTGESIGVQKQIEKIDTDCEIGDQKNMLFSSTSIINGSCIGIVVKTGTETEIGKISKMISETENEMTPLQKRLDIFGRKLGYAIIAICFFIFIITTSKELISGNITFQILLDTALISVALAVAAVPTALPGVVTIALSIGVKRLLKKNALVKNLSSVETLGSCNVICTDKTGTLTKNEMTVKDIWSINYLAKVEGIGYNPNGVILGKYNKKILEIGALCNNASHFKKDNFWQISGDPTEACLLVVKKKAKIDISSFERFDELPFDSTRKIMSVLVKDNNSNKKFIYTKGAFDKILSKCSYLIENGKKIKLNKEYIKKIKKENDKFSSEAKRVLGFAYKEITSRKQDKINFDDENNLIFVGLIAMMDPPRENIEKSINKAKKAGIRIIMITGDYIETAKAIAKKIGIEGQCYYGDSISNLSDNELEIILKDNTNIFARVSPEDKQRIVTILQKLDFVVAMTGDGVNDAPALKKADIGIAVGSGTEVAKEAADFILLNDGFSNIVNAIEEGRGIYENIQKSIMLLLSGNLGEVLIIFLAILFNMNLPLTAIQLLWINLITDGAPALAFSVDPYSKNIMNKKPKEKNEEILPTPNLLLIGFLGTLGSILGLILFYFFSKENLILGQTMIFNFVILFELILVYIIRSFYKTKLFSNFWLWISVIFSIILQAIIMYSPISNIFKITELNLKQLTWLLFTGIIFILFYIMYILIEKLINNLKKNIKTLKIKKI